MAALTYDNISAVTRDAFLPIMRDNIYRANPLLPRLRGRQIAIQDGKAIMAPVLYAQNTSSGSYSGNESLTITAVETVTAATFNWKQHYGAITIDGLSEIKNNAGENSVLNNLQTQFMNTEKTIGDNIMDDLWSDGTGNSGKAITGFGAAVDDGGDVATYGGIDRASHTWWKSVVNANGGTARAITLALVRDLIGDVEEGSDRPTLLVSRVGVYNKIWGLMQADQRYIAVADGGPAGNGLAGFSALMVDNVPLIVDSRVPSDGATKERLYALNERYLELVVHPSRDIVQTDFIRPREKDERTALILWAGNLIGSNCRMQARLDDLDPAL